MTNKLAIIIPAYKSDFFDLALSSIANQTSKNFTLYIGDDCSPENLYSIAHNYQDKIDIIYKRFERNLGGEDLVAHWERCIDMLKDEEWVWLFSDDDLMGANCVEEFYKAIEEQKQFDLYRFNLSIINEKGVEIKGGEKESFPKIIDAYSFFKKRVSGKINSYVVEFVFRRNKLFEVGRFQNFDLAWGSDVATWLKIADDYGVYTINNSAIQWRSSGVNISPNVSEVIVLRKAQAVINFFDWAYRFFEERNKSILFFCHLSMFQRIKGFACYLSKNQLNYVIRTYCERFPCSKMTFIFMKMGLRIFLNRYL